MEKQAARTAPGQAEGQVMWARCCCPARRCQYRQGHHHAFQHHCTVTYSFDVASPASDRWLQRSKCHSTPSLPISGFSSSFLCCCRFPCLRWPNTHPPVPFVIPPPPGATAMRHCHAPLPYYPRSPSRPHSAWPSTHPATCTSQAPSSLLHLATRRAG